MNNKDKVQNFFKLLTEQKVEEAFHTYIATEFKHHNQQTKAGRLALLEGMSEAHQQFPLMKINVNHVFEDGAYVTTHSLVKMSPEHPGFVCVHICRFHDGKIAEFWDVASPIIDNSVNEDGAF